ncbi:MAG: acetyl-CoA carboxylase biotin carboxyl carrier protein [Proteobacteria bacterium]|jgi:acetyl-CoA carboxylase biotin carboxyl carrier protein|nr:acetyl-CoA carboxylase biotin carboxyl carrier protein [Alphaproteobacteria bacterium]NCC03249.1 acetyl-CoA carboxylase biotin carboxyl carrier protein [Pseudomonadota bacterium]
MSQFELDMKFVRSLAELLKETGLTEIEYAEGDKRIRCVGAQPVVQVAAGAPVATAPVPTIAAPVAAASAAGPQVAAGTPVTAPMVGTVYLAPEPSAPSFVRVGDTVKEGDTLLIIEAMKVMNPIKAPVSGTIAQVLIGDAKPVEYGDTLMVIA